MTPFVVKPDMLVRAPGRLVWALTAQGSTMAFGSAVVVLGPPTWPIWTVATTWPWSLVPPMRKITSPTCAATPSVFASTRGCCATQGCSGLPVLAAAWLFQTLRVAAVPSVPPMTTIPSETGTAEAPATGEGSASLASVAHWPIDPSFAMVRLNVVVVGFPSGPSPPIT